MNTHHMVINNLNEFMNSRNQNENIILGYDFKNQNLYKIVENNYPPYIIKIGKFPAWRTMQDILDIIFKNILDNKYVTIDNNGLYYKTYYMEWN